MSKTADQADGGRCYTVITPLDLSDQVNKGKDKLSHACKDHAMCSFYMAPISIHANELIDKYELIVRPSVYMI